MNGRPVWDEAIAAFVPAPNAVPGLTPAGAANGRFATADCLADASPRLRRLGCDRPSGRGRDGARAEAAPYAIQPHWHVPGEGRAWLDFANDVTVKDVKLSAQENFRSVEHMKRYTTQGMAPDQGKNSNVAALAILADVTGRAIPETERPPFAPAFSPVSIAAMVAGAGPRASRLSASSLTSDRASRDLGAPMIEAGQWYRPSYFPKPGETTWRQACDREVTMVRQKVGVADVSTLGKIDIQGADAARFLDLVYTNTFSTLPVGRVRYGPHAARGRNGAG